MTPTLLRFMLLLVLTATLASCKAGGAPSPYTVLDDDAQALRDPFNKNAGHVRVVMLVAPT